MLETTRTLRVLEILNLAAGYLADQKIENARLNAERLMAHTLKLNRVQLYLNYDRPLNEDELHQFKTFLKRRTRGEPLQYIIGETEFMSLPFKVKPSVLIPRPETEILVEAVLDKCRETFHSEDPLRILDIGTGSGCIAISLARNMANAIIMALDVSDQALAIASENARLNEVQDKIRFSRFDFLNSDLSTEITKPFDVIVSNPPYVSDHEFQRLPEEIKLYEPLIALKNGTDGLAFYHRIAETSSAILNKEGLVAVEIGMGQANVVHTIFKNANFTKVTSFRDLNNTERGVICEY